MKHYIIFTDINSHQYVFEILLHGINVSTVKGSFVITQDNTNLLVLLDLIEGRHNFVIDNRILFVSKNLVAVECKATAENEY